MKTDRVVLRQITIGSILGFIIGFFVGQRFGLLAGISSGFISGVVLCGVSETQAAVEKVWSALVAFLRYRPSTAYTPRWVGKVGGMLLREVFRNGAVRCARPAIVCALCVAYFLVPIMIAFTVVPLRINDLDDVCGLWIFASIVGGIMCVCFFKPHDAQPFCFPIHWYCVEKRGWEMKWMDTVYKRYYRVWDELDPYSIMSTGVSFSNIKQLLGFIGYWCVLMPVVFAVMLPVLVLTIVVDVLATLALVFAVTKRIVAGFGAAMGVFLDWLLFPSWTGGITDAARLITMALVSAGIGIGVYLLREKLKALDAEPVPT